MKEETHNVYGEIASYANLASFINRNHAQGQAWIPLTGVRKFSRDIFPSVEVFNNTVTLLTKLGYVELYEEKLRFTKKFNSELFFDELFNYFSRLNIVLDLLPVDKIEFDYELEKSFIKIAFIDLKYSRFRNFLISTGFINKISPRDNKLYLNEKHRLFSIWIETFESIEDENVTTPDDLEKMLQSQKEQGLKAELFVLSWEEKRLLKHQKVNQIKHVALTNVSAGYDIKSYKSDKSIFLDLEIEVKSYYGQPHFYLSNNEFNRASKMKESYCIYLVDMNRINDTNYEPKRMFNPVEVIEDVTLWSKECSSISYKMVT